MKFHTCCCGKYSLGMRCIYTGVEFEHNGEVFCGDMFFCGRCRSISIHGIPHSRHDRMKYITAKFDGLLFDETDRYMATDNDGIIELLPKAIEYITTKGCPSLDLHKYEVKS